MYLDLSLKPFRIKVKILIKHLVFYSAILLVQSVNRIWYLGREIDELPGYQI